MAKEKKSGGGVGGCLVQIVLGFLAAMAAILAVLFFTSAPLDAPEDRSIADDAAATAVTGEPLPEVVAPASAPVTAAPRPAVLPTIPRPVDAGTDPAGDDQIADDAAAAGMTSRSRSRSGE